MKSDIEIAQEAKVEHIRDVAARIGIEEIRSGFIMETYKAKISDELWNKVKDHPDGKLVLVTAINPTAGGEGKTTITVGLGQAMAHIGKKAVIALREPSLGPMFWSKRRSSRRRICSGCADGRSESPFYRRFSCDYISQ